jgi:(p)ppGpp synthase/HD superfamily hydrolase
MSADDTITLIGRTYGKTTITVSRAEYEGQVDKAGQPYIDHPRTVARILTEQGHDQRTIMAGLLHDVVEDTDITLDRLRHLGYPEEVVRAVDSVTKRPGETYMDMVRRAAADPIGKWVKLADNATNSDPERLALLSGEEQEWFTQKYAKARAVLLGEVS